MALEAVVFPQDPFTYGCNKDNYLYSLFGGGGSAASDKGSWSHDYYGGSQTAQEKALLGIANNNNIDNNNNHNNYNNNNLHANWDCSSPSVLQNVKDQWDSHSHSSPETTCTTVNPPPSSTTMGRRKRRRTKRAKNEEEIENQRMTHIAVERNRRKQMNEYLAVLRSLMPSSYVQRGDQASIIGGAINFVKELEQLLQCMKGQKNMKEQKQEAQENNNGSSPPPLPFAEFFMFPQYSTRATQGGTCYPAGTSEEGTTMMVQNSQNLQSRAVADIEVSLVDGHANIKILVKKRHGQLAKMVVGLQSLGFSILHLNVTTVDDMVLATVSVKVEEGCEMNTVDEIAAAVNQLSRTVQEEDAAFS